MTASTSPRLGTVGSIVDDRVGALQARYLSTGRNAAAVAALARLRRGVGKPPGELIDILEYTVDEAFGSGRDDLTATPGEVAAHTAMTLYATHQQSRPDPMHRRGQGLGTALRALHSGPSTELPPPLVARFRMLGTADSFAELAYHLRGAVQLLRASGVPLDYGVLADQLVNWQRRGPDRVQLTWGRQFYRVPKSAEQTTTTPREEA